MAMIADKSEHFRQLAKKRWESEKRNKRQRAAALGFAAGS